MFMILSSLYDTDSGHDNTYACHYDTDNFNCTWYLYVPFIVFSIMYHLQDTGSSQNEIILAKGEPLKRLGNTWRYDIIKYRKFQYKINIIKK